MTDILEIIRPHVHLERQGKNYVGLCPFHQEKTPSFTVDPSEQTFCCLGCGACGDAGEFVNLMLTKGPGVVLNVNLHIAPNFTGRVVVQLKEGRHVCDYPLVNGEHIATLPSFLEMARLAGWSVTPEQGDAMRNVKVLDAFNALNKIQALAAAAGFLTSSEEEEEMCFSLVDLIEGIAREAAEADHG
ncbi:CHC2 zinc finger domain-containing protein [Salmonella enterica subsp. diarizonae serovar 65:(k):z]